MYTFKKCYFSLQKFHIALLSFFSPFYRALQLLSAWRCYISRVKVSASNSLNEEALRIVQPPMRKSWLTQLVLHRVIALRYSFLLFLLCRAVAMLVKMLRHKIGMHPIACCIITLKLMHHRRVIYFYPHVIPLHLVHQALRCKLSLFPEANTSVDREACGGVSRAEPNIYSTRRIPPSPSPSPLRRGDDHTT